MYVNFILKLTNFCNLDCSYCYMFNSADRTFERKPRTMSADVAVAALDAIRSQIARQNDGGVSIVLHGGEPTLWPLESFQAFFAAVERMRAEGLKFSVGLQTNLWRKPPRALLDLLRKHRVALGVSVDGPAEIHDANRVDLAGKGTYAKTLANVRDLLNAGYSDIVGGFLCVMQPSISPEDFLAWVASLPRTSVNLIWPLDFNQVAPPWLPEEADDYAHAPHYGSWLARLFDAWWALDRPEIEIGMFMLAIQGRLGSTRSGDILGARAFRSAVVDTDGAIALSDYFRTSADGASFTGYSVLGDSFEAVDNDPRIRAMREVAESLPAPCGRCEHNVVCAGGTLAGRLDGKGEVTANPSVLCSDHLAFFDAVARRVDAAAAAEGRPTVGRAAA